ASNRRGCRSESRARLGGGELDAAFAQANAVVAARDRLQRRIGIDDHAVGAHDGDAVSEPVERALERVPRLHGTGVSIVIGSASNSGHAGYSPITRVLTSLHTYRRPSARSRISDKCPVPGRRKIPERPQARMDAADQ